MNRTPIRANAAGPTRGVSPRASRVDHGFRSTPTVSRARPSVQRAPYRRHNYYSRNDVSLSYRFGPGSYWGVKYYQPFCHYPTRRHFAFFYSAPVSYVYVPFGFYEDCEPVYIDRTVYVREEYPVEEYETEEILVDPGHGPIFDEVEPAPRTPAPEEETGIDPQRDPVFEEMEPELEAEPEQDEVVRAPEAPAVPEPEAPVEDAKRKTKVYRDPHLVDPVPAAGSPAAEKFLRQASRSFRVGDYEEAATLFRHAALAIPGDAAPLFAMGQALIALEQDAYAARVIRQAVALNPKLLDEPGDISGVYINQKEFDRILEGLEERAATEPVDSDALFLLGVQRYFSGDPRSRDAFDKLFSFVPSDRVSAAFLRAIEARFPDEELELPPVETK